MRRFALAVVAALCGVDALDGVQAQAMTERAIVPTIGCYVMGDLERIMQAHQRGHWHLDKKIMKQEEAEGDCFNISVGTRALSNRLWEPYPMMWNGIIKLRGHDHLFFFSPIEAWRATRR